MLTPFRRQNAFFPTLNDVFGENFLNDSDWTTSPAVNIAENSDGYRIELAAPGLNKEDFHINIEKRMLEISSEKQSAKVNEPNNSSNGDHYYRREFVFTSFKRTFSLPDVADTDKISANYKDGLLLVNIPKKEQAKEKPSRVIDIE